MMKITIKTALKDFARLVSHLPADSPAHEAIAKATPIQHSLEGVEFEGYSIPCDETQARILLEVARNCCPEIIPDIEKAIRLPRT